MSQNYVLLNDFFLRESRVVFNNPEQAAEGGKLDFLVSAENILDTENLFSLDFMFTVIAKKDDLIVFEIFCKFNASIKITRDIDVKSKDIQKELAAIGFLQIYPNMREYVTDNLRKMNLLVAINAIPISIDFDYCNIKINN